MNLFASVIAPLGVLSSAAGLAVLYRHLPVAGGVLPALVVMIAGVAGWLTIGVVILRADLSGLEVPVGALAAVAALLVTLAVRERTGSFAAATLFAVSWTAAVFVPVAIVIHGSNALPVMGMFSLDHGGAIAGLLAPGAAIAAILLSTRHSTELRPATRTPASILLISLVLFASWTAWLVGMELAIDEATPRILLNAACAGIFGVIGWLIVQRIHHDRATIAAASAGLVSGLSSVTAGVSFLDPIWASVTGIVAAIFAATFVHRRIRLSGRASWFLVGVHLLAPLIGLVLLGMFAKGAGMLFTGQLGFLVTEVTVAVAVIAYSALVSAVLWGLIRLAWRLARVPL
jgi:Amt family ammonium transporter